jgi:hypothetical protein
MPSSCWRFDPMASMDSHQSFDRWVYASATCLNSHYPICLALTQKSWLAKHLVPPGPVNLLRDLGT